MSQPLVAHNLLQLFEQRILNLPLFGILTCQSNRLGNFLRVSSNNLLVLFLTQHRTQTFPDLIEFRGFVQRA